MFTHLLLAAGDPVEADLVQAAGVELVDTVDDDGGHHGRGARHVVRQLPAAAQRGLAWGSLSGSSRDTGQGDLLPALRVTHCPALPAFVHNLQIINTALSVSEIHDHNVTD